MTRKSPNIYIVISRRCTTSANNLLKKDLKQRWREKHREIPSTPNILDGKKEAKLITIACSKPPDGRGRWTLRLLTEKLIELEIVDTISPNTVGRALKKRVKTAPSKMLGNTSRSKR